MYPSQQHYQYAQQSQQPSAPPPQQQQQPSTQPPPQQQQQPYQGYVYPPPPHPPPGPPAGPPSAQGYNSYPPSSYPYQEMPAPGYYYLPAGYPPTYPGPPPYQSSYSSRPPYPPQPSTIPPQYPPYNPQPSLTNGYHHNPPIQPYPSSRLTPGHANSPPSKRQKLSQPNGSHSHKHSRRNSTKERKTFSDFRVSKIKIGNFTSEEIQWVPSARDSRLRFYFRSRTPSTLPSPRRQTTPQDNIAVQYPDRLSVSLLGGTRRIVIPATGLTAVTFNRAEGYVKIEGDGFATFEEVVYEEADETVSTTKSGYPTPKFVPSGEDPTGGEWARCKIMEIWLNTAHPLTEPKWARGNLRDNIEASSLFQNIIHITGIVEFHPGTFDEMVESWRDQSMVGSVDSRNLFVADLATTEKLVDLLERIVHFSFPPFTPMVEGLLALIKDKDTLHEELKRIILGTAPDGIWRALDSIMMEEVDHQRESSHSVSSFNQSSLKREREEDHDEEMDTTSNGRDESLRDRSLPTSAVDNISEAPETSSVNVESLGDGEIAPHDESGMNFGIPGTTKTEALSESTM